MRECIIMNGMFTSQEKKYWKGIARAQNQMPLPGGNIQERLSFLDEAFNFTCKIKGEVATAPTTAIELYKKWRSIKNRNGPSV